jgi:transposase
MERTSWIERYKRISRGKLLDFFAARASCTVALEACGGGHHWARQLTKLGHEVRLVRPPT